MSLQCAAKTYPLKLFAIFKVTTWNFYVKFYTFITCSYTHKNAKRHLIAFNYCKVTELFV